MGIDLKKLPLFFLLILVAAFILRMYQLGQQSFWYDEACSLAFAARSPWSIFSDHYFLRPFYFLFLNLWSHIFGISEIISRLPSVVFGVGSVYLIKKLGEEMFDRRVGLAAAFFLAFSYFHIVWSQQARNYSLLVFLCLAAGLFFFRLTRKSSLKYYLFYAGAVVLSLLTSLVGGLMIVPAIVYAYFQRHSFHKKNWFIAHGIIGAALCLMLVFSLIMSGSIKEDIQASNSGMPVLSRIIDLLGSFSYGGGKIAQGATANRMDESLHSIHFIVFVFFLVFYWIGIMGSLRFQKQRLVYLLLWQWSPVLVLVIASFISGISWFNPKYLIFTMPAFYLIVARGVCCIQGKGFMAFLLGGLVCLNAVSFKEYYYPYDHSSWRELAAVLKTEVHSQDVIILAPQEQLVSFWLYYDKDQQFLSRMGNGVNGKFIHVKGVWNNYFYKERNLVWGVHKDHVVLSLEQMEMFQKDKTDGVVYWLIVSSGWLGSAQYDAMTRYLNERFDGVMEREYLFDGIQLFRLMRKE